MNIKKFKIIEVIVCYIDTRPAKITRVERIPLNTLDAEYIEEFAFLVEVDGESCIYAFDYMTEIERYFHGTIQQV